MTDASQAAAQAAARRVKRAAGLLREAARDLAAAAEGDTALGSVRVHDATTSNAAHDLIALGVAKHGAVDVLVLPRGAGRQPHDPHQGPTTGEGEPHD